MLDSPPPPGITLPRLDGKWVLRGFRCDMFKLFKICGSYVHSREGSVKYIHRYSFATIIFPQMSPQKLSPCFSSTNVQPQKLPFSKPINSYILSKLEASQLRKLYQTCKFFYLYFPLKWVLEIEYFEFSVQNEKNIRKIQKLPSYFATSYSIYFFERQLHVFKTLLPKIVFCDLQFLSLHSSNFFHLSWNDYKFLTDAGNIKDLVFHNVLVFNETASQSHLSFDQLIARLPNADKVR